jgi:putative transposase
MIENSNAPDDAMLWEEACRCTDAIRIFVRRRHEGSKRPSVSDLAQELSLSRATTYRMIELFRTGHTVTSLMGKSPGRPKGYRTLDKEREGVIQKTIETFYLKPTKLHFPVWSTRSAPSASPAI